MRSQSTFKGSKWSGLGAVAALIAAGMLLPTTGALADSDPFPGVETSARIWALPFISGPDWRTSPEGDPIGCPAGSRITREIWSGIAVHPADYWEMYCVKTWEPTARPSPTPSMSSSASGSATPGTSASGSAAGGAVVEPAAAVVTDQGDQEGVVETIDAEIKVAVVGDRWVITLTTNSPETSFSVTARKPGARMVSWTINSGTTGATSFRSSRKLTGYTFRVRYQGETLDVARA